MNLQSKYRETTQPLKELFFGSHFLSLFGHPYAINRTGLKQSIKGLADLTKPGPTIDIGCGIMPYRKLFKQHVPYEGIEIETRHKDHNKLATHFYDGHTLPLADNSYNSVLCFQVLEHCSDPELMLQECHRVLNEGGTLLLTMPLIWPEHEQPWDFQRFTYYGIARHLEKSGFKIERIEKVNPGLACIIQISIDWIDSLHRRISRRISNRAARRVLLVTWRIWTAPAYTFGNIIAALARSTSKRFHPKNGSNNKPISEELYLDLAVVATKVAADENSL